MTYTLEMEQDELALLKGAIDCLILVNSFYQQSWYKQSETYGGSSEWWVEDHAIDLRERLDSLSGVEPHHRWVDLDDLHELLVRELEAVDYIPERWECEAWAISGAVL